MTAPNSRPNPYVGPRSFQTGEKLYGRDVEIRQLVDLLISERIVLLHSPSGAGKSSLIRAGLVPCLQDEGFTVLPVIRVNLEPPAGLKSAPGFNRFVYSTLVSLAENEPGIDPQKLAGLTLSDYMKQREPEGSLTALPLANPQENPSPHSLSEKGGSSPHVNNAKSSDEVRRTVGLDPLQRVIIFDQFEEVLNVDPTNREAKAAFFRQLGDALDDPDLWALFAIREDYLPALDPYLRPIPTRLKNTYRLDLLGADAARQAIQQPARAAGVIFEDGTARRLVDDLRRVKIQQPDGSVEEQLGPYVEPLQLQVVCFRLWEKLAPDDTRIDDADLTALGDVNQSLSDYYGQRVAAAAKESNTSERSIREWFDRRLITEGGMRGQVLMGQGLDTAVVRLLENAHLVRGEKRGGATWYELTHDRLVQPIRQNNAAWFQTNLSLLQRQASLWDQQGRSEGVLLRGAPLAEAEGWAASHASALTAGEKDFLTSCRKEAQAAQRLRQRTQAVMFLGVLALVAAIAAVFFAIRAEGQKNFALAQQAQAVTQRNIAEQQKSAAEQQKAVADAQRANAVAAQEVAKSEEAKAQSAKQEAERQGNISTLLQLYTQSSNLVTRQPDLSLLLSLELNKIAALPGMEDYHAQAYESLANTVLQQDPHLYRILRGHTGGVESIAVRPDGSLLASAGLDGKVLLWNPQTGEQMQPVPLPVTRGTYVYSVVFSGDGNLLAFGRDDGKVFIWDLQKNTWVWDGVQAHNHRTELVVFSADRKLLATASCGDYNANLSTCSGGEIKIWQIAQKRAITIKAHSNWIEDLVFSPDGRTLFSNSIDALRAWDTATGRSAGDMNLTASAITLTPDGSQLAYWDEESNRIGLIDANNRQFTPTFIYPKSTLPVQPVTPDQPNTTNGQTDASQPFRPPLMNLPVLTGPDTAADAAPALDHSNAESNESSGLATLFQFDPTGKRIAVGGADEKIHLIDAATGDDLIAPLSGHTDRITDIRFFGPNGRFMATSSYDSRILIWDLEANNHVSKVISGLVGQSGLWYVVPSPDETWMASNNPNQEPKDGIRIWDLKTLKELKVLKGPIFARLRVSPDGKYLAAGGGSRGSPGSVYLWSMPEGKLIFSNSDTHFDQVTDIAFNPNGQYLFSIGGNKIVVWETKTGKQVNVVPFKVDYGSSLAVNRGGTQIAIAYGVAVQIFSFPDMKPIGPRIPHEDPNHIEEWALTLGFSRDDKLLAIGGGDKSGTAKTIRVWNLETREQVTPALSGHQASIGSLLFSPDNNFLVSLGYDGYIKLWDLASRDVTHPLLNEHVPDAKYMLFTPDGNELHVYGTQGSINYWKIGSDYLKSVACRIANRNLSEAEWKLYVSASQPLQATCR